MINDKLKTHNLFIEVLADWRLIVWTSCRFTAAQSKMNISSAHSLTFMMSIS